MSTNGNVLKLTYGIVLPYNLEERGGVCDRNLNFISESANRESWYKAGGMYNKSSELEYTVDNRKVLFIGYFVKHWGHFLMDCLGRSWALLDGKYKEHKIVYLTKSWQALNGNYKRFFELLGVADRMIDVQQPTMFSEVVIPQNLASEKYHPQLFFEPFKYVGRHFSSSLEVPPKVYFSRQHFSVAKSKELGEVVIQKQFERNGFTVMYPEELPLDDQIAVFSKAETVACVNGTIPLTAAMFVQRKKTLIVLSKMSLRHGNLINVCRETGMDPVYLNVYKEPIKGHPQTLGNGPFWMVFNENAKKYFDEHGLTYKLPPLYGIQLLWESILYVLMYTKVKTRKAIVKQMKQGKATRRYYYKMRKLLGKL